MRRLCSRFRPTFDSLENRLVPAGNINALLVSGSLTLTGDALANSVTLSQPGAGQLTLTPDATTSISGGPAGAAVTFANITGSVTLNMGAGDDSVIFDWPQTINLPLDLTINGGAGNNTINNVNGTAATSVNVFRNLRITNGAGNDSTALGNLNAGGSITINNGDGDSTTQIHGIGATANVVGGSLAITNGRGFDFNEIFRTNVGKNLTINNGFGNATTGDGTDTTFGTFGAGVSALQLTIGGSATVTNLSGKVDQERLADVDVGGNILFSAGSGTSARFVLGQSLLTGIGVVHGNVTIAAATAGSTGINLGAAHGLDILGNLSITTGSQSDGISIQNGVLVQGATTISTGAADDTLFVRDATFNNRVSVNMGDGADKMALNTGTVSNTVNFLNAVSVAMGNGNDTVDIGSQATTANFFGALSVNLGAGDDSVRLGGSATVNLFGTSKFDGSTGGNDTATVNLTTVTAVFSNPVFLNFP